MKTNEIMYRIYKGGSILLQNALLPTLDKLHPLIKRIENKGYFEPILRSLLLDSYTYGMHKKIRLFYKDDVLIDYLLSDEIIKLLPDEKLVNSTIMLTYYDLLKMEHPNYNHKTLLFNLFAELNDVNTCKLSKDWNLTRQYTNKIKLGKQNISENLKVKIATYFKFDVKLFNEEYFNNLKGEIK